MSKMLIVAASALLCSFSSFVAEAQVYTWTDSKGNVVFSDRPSRFESTNTEVFVSIPAVDTASQAVALAMRARERLKASPFSIPERMLAKQEIAAAQRLDEYNGTVELAWSEFVLQQLYYSGDAFSANSYNATGLNIALLHAQNAVKFEPENVLTLGQLALMLLIQNEMDEAWQLMLQMNQIAPDS